MPMEGGRYAVIVDAGELASGHYLLELRYGTGRAVEKIIVQR
jgi:hypothetical protein